MSKVELRPTHLHWMENGDPFRDLCVHGGIYLRIGELVVSDGTDLDWTVSTAAFNLLRTILEDQPLEGREALIPHCGFTMWQVSSEPDGLYIPNCDIGINWSLTHRADEVLHEFVDGTIVTTDLQEWKAVVFGFADEVYHFLHTAWPKVIDDEEDRRGFELFISLWEKRRSGVEPVNGK
jgi:hypothetical protein